MTTLSKDIVLNQSEISQKVISFIHEDAECSLCTESKVRHKHFYLDAKILCDPNEAPKAITLECAQCGNLAVSLACAKCCKIYYCSPACSKLNWSIHVSQCMSTVSLGGDSNGHNESGSRSVGAPILSQPAEEQIVQKTHVTAPEMTQNDTVDSGNSSSIEDITSPLPNYSNATSKKKVLIDIGPEATVIGFPTIKKEEPKVASPSPANNVSVVTTDLYAGILEKQIQLELNKPVEYDVVWNSELDSEVFFLMPADKNQMQLITTEILKIKSARDFNDIKPLDIKAATVGSYCLAESPDDSEIYRARILEVKDDEYRIIFVDYGNFSTVALDKMFPLPDALDLTYVPVQSVPAKANDPKKIPLLRETYNQYGKLALVPIRRENRTYLVEVQ